MDAVRFAHLQSNADLFSASLADALEQITGQGSFSHLSALANHSKHRSIVQPQLNEDLTGLRADRHEVRFSSFTYKGLAFPEASIKALLEPEYARCSQLVVQVGESLNHVLQEIAQEPTYSEIDIPMDLPGRS